MPRGPLEKKKCFPRKNKIGDRAGAASLATPLAVRSELELSASSTKLVHHHSNLRPKMISCILFVPQKTVCLISLDRLVPDARAEGDRPPTPAYYLIISSFRSQFIHYGEPGNRRTILLDFISRSVSWYASVKGGRYDGLPMTSPRHGSRLAKMWSNFSSTSN